MKPLAFFVALLLLLGGASAASASPGLETAVTTAISDLALDGIVSLTPSEMAALTGSAPGWVQAGCAAVGGFSGGRALGKHLAKRVVVSTVCPWCGVGLTVAAIGCLFI